MELGSLTTDDLIALFAEAWEEYWRLSDSLTLEESRKSRNRKDLDQARFCEAIAAEILARPAGESMKLVRLLDDHRPGVKLRAASTLEPIALHESVRAYRELSLRPSLPNGMPDGYAAKAGLALDRLAESGKI